MIDDPEKFAERWVAAWNSRDAEAVLAHYVDACVFTSPKAAAIAGRATLEGKAALRAYWQAALARIATLHFRLERALWDESASTLTVVYDAMLNGTRSRAIEIMRFNKSGMIEEGEAFYGATV